jgi:tetratricopeptide (TPR) repeat protein
MNRSIFTAVATYVATIFATLSAAVTAPAAAADTVEIKSGSRFSGTLQRVSAGDVLIEVKGELAKIPVHHIEAIEFDGEPAEMKQIRSALRENRGKDAIALLDKIDPAPITRKEIKQDLAFYRARAMAIQGGIPIKEFGTAMFNFAAANPDSYHYLHAKLRIAHWLAADGNLDAALKAFDELAKCSNAHYQMQAVLGRGRSYRDVEKYPEALAELEKVAALPDNRENRELREEAQILIDDCRELMGKTPTTKPQPTPAK